MRYSAYMTRSAITSPSNERIKRLVRLRERRHRDREGVFVVEGLRLFERAIASGHRPLEIYTDGSIDDPRLTDSTLVSSEVLDKASYRQASEGLITVFEQFETTLHDINPSSPALVVVAESVEKPGNLGAMIRTASAVGADALITVGSTTDVFNPNVIRSSTGAMFSLPLASTDLSSLGTWLGGHSIALVAASPDADRNIWEVDLTGPTALMIGAEDTGLSPEAVDSADYLVSIPMSKGVVDSLNASISLAVVAYEMLRQRSIL